MSRHVKERIFKKDLFVINFSYFNNKYTHHQYCSFVFTPDYSSVVRLNTKEQEKEQGLGCIHSMHQRFLATTKSNTKTNLIPIQAYDKDNTHLQRKIKTKSRVTNSPRVTSNNDDETSLIQDKLILTQEQKSSGNTFGRIYQMHLQNVHKSN